MAEETKVAKKRSPETVKRQILTNAKKYLTELASKRYEEAKARGEEAVYEPPSDEAIAAECKKRWQKHLDGKKEKEDISRFFE